MASIRPAVVKDKAKIFFLLKELDLYYENLIFKDFFVAEDNRKIIGAVQFEQFTTFYYLSSLGVSQEYQHHGLARLLLKRILSVINKPVYLYTIIPDFFTRFGFKIITAPPPNLPTKKNYECRDCFPDKCVTMVKYPDAA
ncbi:GNAT family N-acetyltransferase [Candidatus Saganbacteria bacterium]|nr:GNAT family N-acetyltransferase [Candidatus Saganbacteria bacterium]